MKKRKKIPLFLWVLDLWPESLVANSNIKSGPIINLIEKIVRRIYKAADVILISSKFFREAILEKCEDKSKKIVYFPNWAEDVFTREIIKSEESLQLPEGFNIMFAGNVGDSQDFEAVVQAAVLTENDKINWIIIGDGRKSDWIKEEIENKSINNVFLLGAYPLEKMPVFFKQADAMLVCLKDIPIFALTVPAKVQAYLASGKMILGMLNGEGKDLINESGSGIAVNAGDYVALADAAKHLRQKPIEDKLKLEENSKLFYKDNFSKEKLFEKLEDLFLKVSNKKQTD